MHSILFIGLVLKFLDNGSQPFINGSTRNLNTILVWGQAIKPTFEIFLPIPKNLAGKTSNSSNRRQSRKRVTSKQLNTYRQTKIVYTRGIQHCLFARTLYICPRKNAPGRPKYNGVAFEILGTTSMKLLQHNLTH